MAVVGAIRQPLQKEICIRPAGGGGETAGQMQARKAAPGHRFESRATGWPQRRPGYACAAAAGVARKLIARRL